MFVPYKCTSASLDATFRICTFCGDTLDSIKDNSYVLTMESRLPHGGSGGSSLGIGLKCVPFVRIWLKWTLYCTQPMTRCILHAKEASNSRRCNWVRKPRKSWIFIWKIWIFIGQVLIFIGDITADNDDYFVSIIFPVILLFFIVFKIHITVKAKHSWHRFTVLPPFPMYYNYTGPS